MGPRSPLGLPFSCILADGARRSLCSTKSANRLGSSQSHRDDRDFGYLGDRANRKRRTARCPLSCRLFVAWLHLGTRFGCNQPYRFGERAFGGAWCTGSGDRLASARGDLVHGSRLDQNLAHCLVFTARCSIKELEAKPAGRGYDIRRYFARRFLTRRQRGDVLVHHRANRPRNSIRSSSGNSVGLVGRGWSERRGHLLQPLDDDV